MGLQFFWVSLYTTEENLPREIFLFSSFTDKKIYFAKKCPFYPDGAGREL